MLDPTLFGLLNLTEGDGLVLPAMQRPFVWREDRIYRLIDSLLRGFPIGAVMIWRTATTQRYRRIPRDIDNEIEQVFAFETSTNNSNKYLILDGQQRLTSLFAAFKGTYNKKKLYIDVLSGDSTGKDPGNEYFDCKFLTKPEADSLNALEKEQRQIFMPIQDLARINPVHAATSASQKAKELKLTDAETACVTNIYIRCASILGNNKSLQVITIDEDPSYQTPIEEILEVFVRVNSGGLVLLKSDLLMTLLDLEWNDIQPELQKIVREINESRPFKFTRDDLLKSLLLADGSETRFDRLVSDRNLVKQLSSRLPNYTKSIKTAWLNLGCILVDNCKIYSERFFRGGHNALLPFVVYLSQNQSISNQERKRIVIAIYITLMSGVFGSAESRMNSFTRKNIKEKAAFPLEALAQLVQREYGVKSLDDLLRRHLDLSLNIAHGGITLDKNPDELQRDHIFPRSFLEKAGYSHEMVNHYANFHFLRGSDNLNKLDKPPHEWFKTPGRDIAAYSDSDLDDRLITWENLQPGKFDDMILERGKRIRKKAIDLFGENEEFFLKIFEQQKKE